MAPCASAADGDRVTATLDRWRAVPGCPCGECADAAPTPPRTTLRLAGDVEVVLETRPENAQDALDYLQRLPAPRFNAGTKAKPSVPPLRTTAQSTTDKALETLKRMGWL